jgi:hypothetical protein
MPKQVTFLTFNFKITLYPGYPKIFFTHKQIEVIEPKNLSFTQ